MVASRERAADIAEGKIGDSNKVGTCQLWTRTIYDAGSVGDQDGDGDADAVDGWKSEPSKYQHTDRKPPRGTPVAWSGGRKGYGHRAISLGPDSHGIYQIATIDAPRSGVVGKVPLEWFENNWGLKYLGWTDSISGQLIENNTAPVKPTVPPKPVVKPKTKHSWKVARAIKLLESEQRNSKLPSKYRDFVRAAVTQVKKVPFTK